MRRSTGVAAGLVLGYGADRLFGDPARFHPVAGFGRAALLLERVDYRDSRGAGAVHAGLLVGAAALVGRSLRGPFAVAVATWAVLGGSSLARAGLEMARLLEAGDVDAGRALLPSLCGRDPAALDADGLARAALESVAENTADAAVAPLLCGALFGMPGLLGYRAINTLDAMVGYRNDRYLRFGWASARADDAANLLPARVTGVLTAMLAPTVGGSPAQAIRVWRRDAAGHPSPNAGVVEATAAGALGIRLGGRTEYPHGVELRPILGDGPAPGVDDLRRAVRLSRAVQVAAALGSAALAVAIGEFRLRRHRRRG